MKTCTHCNIASLDTVEECGRCSYKVFGPFKPMKCIYSDEECPFLYRYGHRDPSVLGKTFVARPDSLLRLLNFDVDKNMQFICYICTTSKKY